MLRRLATISLTALLLIMSIGVWLLFPLLQGYYRFKAHHTIETQSNTLVTLRLQSSEFKRVGSNEIEHKGLRYDFKSEQQQNGLYIFSAYPDHYETKLLAFFSETWQSITDTPKSNSPVSQFIHKLLTTDYFCTWTYFDFGKAFIPLTKPSFSYFLSDFWAYSASLYLPPEGQ